MKSNYDREMEKFGKRLNQELDDFAAWSRKEEGVMSGDPTAYWWPLDDGISHVLEVPSGMLLNVKTRSGHLMCFVPCKEEEKADWLLHRCEAYVEKEIEARRLWQELYGSDKGPTKPPVG